MCTIYIKYSITTALKIIFHISLHEIVWNLVFFTILYFMNGYNKAIKQLYMINEILNHMLAS